MKLMSILGILCAYTHTIAQPNLLIIDVQKKYIAGDPQSFYPSRQDSATNASLQNLENNLKKGTFKVIRTYEYADTGAYASPSKIEKLIPKNAFNYVKTFYDASKHPLFAQQLSSLAREPIFVAGAETDVCVFQTLVGLYQKGFNVSIVNDGVYSSEPNTKVARKRLEIIGIPSVNFADIANFKTQAPLIRTVYTLNTANHVILLHSDTTISTKGKAEVERFEPAIIMAKILNIPIYVRGNLDRQLQALLTKHQIEFKTLDSLALITQSYKPMVVHLGLAIHQNLQQIQRQISAMGMTNFTMTDAMISDISNQQLIQSSNAQNLPLTLKMYFYEVQENVAFWFTKDTPKWWKELEELQKKNSFPYVESMTPVF